MSNLLRADFIRMFKSKVFWLCVIFMFGFASVAVYTKWSDSQLVPDYYNPPDGILLAGALYVGIVIAVFIGIFIGTDYSNGTIRNKHVIGHARAAMYLSDLVICVAASVVMHIVYIAVVVGAAGLGITRKFEMSAGNVAAQTLTSIFAVAAFSAILLLVCMLISSRSAGVVSAIILAIMLIFVAGKIDSTLREEEYTTDYAITVADDGGVLFVPQDQIENPRYVTGVKRKALEFVNDLLPVNQISQLMYGKPGETPESLAENDFSIWFPVYSLSLLVVTTVAGILVFRKKDLK